jgi:hypothetical protein
MGEHLLVPAAGDIVRLKEAAAGMPARSEGKLIGWYAGDDWTALVNFWDGGPLRVPAGLVEKVEAESE